MRDVILRVNQHDRHILILDGADQFGKAVLGVGNADAHTFLLWP